MSLRLFSVRSVLLLLPLLPMSLCRAACAGEATSSAEEEEPLPAETQKSLDSLMTMLQELARTLEAIVDGESASRHAAAVEYLIQELYATDYAAFEGGDEEVIAAGLEGVFARIDQSMVRLDDADFYGNADLKRIFGADESALRQLEQGSTPEEEPPAGEGGQTSSQAPGEGNEEEKEIVRESREG